MALLKMYQKSPVFRLLFPGKSGKNFLLYPVEKAGGTQEIQIR